jgi:predicted PurR-regulated permease PerM
VAYTAVLSLLHVRYALILGPLAGIFEFVPVVGPAIAAFIVFVIAVLTSYPHLIWVVVFLAIWRVVQDYVNAPRIMGKSLEISPLVQILAVLAGGEIAGVAGALVSVPAVATLRILWRRLTNEKGDSSRLQYRFPAISARCISLDVPKRHEITRLVR